MATNVYRYDLNFPHVTRRLHEMFARLKSAGLTPLWGDVTADGQAIALPEAQLGRLRDLQKERPEEFGRC